MARFLKPLPLLRRSFLSVPGSHPSAFDENLLRLLRNEISYLSDYVVPRPPPQRFRSFSIEDRPGEQWIRLRSKHGDEDVKVDVTMFDGAAPVPSAPIAEKVKALERGPRLHISLIVEVSRGEASDSVLELICSAWPDSLVVETLFPLHRKVAVFRPYFGRNFKNLEKEVRRQVISYLEERGVDDDLAEFLHEYMTNKDKVELLRWLRIVESYVQK
ncbi:hypothetical protein C4D60_Mb10t22290 [Musa balbisiana]|uniref:Mitochondrial glycoprotein family protein n=1 Tax=Musa balbisiana TaxID=52838 RepID=A0A4S8IYW2_MUSBA|nr:hypothetical protein C4D60_Mb10t22290 [Musa balbisiana]